MSVAGKVSIGTAWTEAASFVRTERGLIAPVVLALILVPVVIAELIKPSAPAGMQPEPGSWMLVSFAALLIGLVAQLAVMRLAMGWNGSVGDVIKLAARRIWPVLGALFIAGFLFALIAIPVIVIILLAGGAPDDAQTTNRLSLLFALVLFAALPRVLPVTAVEMEEHLGPWKLLRRTFALTRGNYWRLLGFLLLFLIGSLLLAGAVTTVVGSAAALLIGPSEPLTVSRLMIALAAGIVQTLVMSVYAAMMGRITAQLLGNASIKAG